MALDIYEHYEEFIGAKVTVCGAYWIAQTFIIQIEHNIKEIELYGNRAGSPGTITVSIRATDANGKPTGSDLTSGTANANAWGTEPSWHTIAVTTFTPTKGAKYAIVTRAPTGDTDNAVWLGFLSPGNFYLGDVYDSENSGTTWSSAYPHDQNFRIKGDEHTIGVTTHTEENVTRYSATLVGEITSGPQWDVKRQFEYREGTSGDWVAVEGDVGGEGKYYANLTDLKAGTDYQYRAVAYHNGLYCGQNKYTGSTESFTTTPGPPYNFEASNIQKNSLDLAWTIGEGEAGEVTTLIRRRDDKFPTSVTDGKQVYSGGGSSCSDSHLNPGVLYFYAAWTQRSGASNSARATFAVKTAECPKSGSNITFYSGPRDGWLRRVNSNYTTCHNAANANAKNDTSADIYCGQNTGYYIWRSALFFNTSGLPKHINITSAKLGLYVKAKDVNAAFEVHVVRGDLTLDGIADADYGALLDEITSYGSIASGDITVSARNYIQLNAAGRAQISPVGTTRFGLRTNKDINSVAPSGLDRVTIDAYGGSYELMLQITYSEATQTPEVVAKVDWNGNGRFDEDYEDISADIKLSAYRMGRDKELGETKCGTLDMRLKNVDKKYTVDNSSSVLYGKVDLGKAVKVYAQFMGQSYPMFVGKIAGLTHHPHWLAKDAYMNAVDGMELLNMVHVSVEYQEAATARWLINKVLDLAGWDNDRTKIMPDYTVFWDVYWNDTPALEIIRDIEAATSGLFYIDRDGKATWEAGYYRTKEVSATPSAEFSNNMAGMIYELNNRNIHNAITCNYTETKWVSSSTVWEGYVHLRYWRRSVVKTARWDKIVRNYTVSYTVFPPEEAGNVKLEVLEKYATSCKFEASFTTGWASVAITITITGEELQYSTCSVHKEDAASIAKYGKRSLTIGGKLVRDSDNAERMAENALTLFKDSHPEVTVTFTNKNNTLMEQILKLGISDRIRVVNGELCLDENYFIDAVDHRVDHTGKLHTVTWKLSECDHQLVFQLDNSHLDSGPRLGLLGG